ncbi:MAG: RyR domain-containing protein [Psychrobacillus sp.]
MINHINDIAKLCHEVNRAYCISIGDNSQPPWNEAPIWQKESAYNGVMFHLNNDVTPEQSHENWLEQKKLEGWTWGPVKDPEKKEHPCFIEYDKLPTEQKTKDYLFKAICDQFKDKDGES